MISHQAAYQLANRKDLEDPYRQKGAGTRKFCTEKEEFVIARLLVFGRQQGYIR